MKRAGNIRNDARQRDSDVDVAGRVIRTNYTTLNALRSTFFLENTKSFSTRYGNRKEEYRKLEQNPVPVQALQWLLSTSSS